ncbi:MAG TPA: VOC family protein [Ilumatobacteraceae bacterium]|nr:VOC family protein [Ilumatobacteraceae bacterium]
MSYLPSTPAIDPTGHQLGDARLRPTAVRWTHIALPATDIEKTIEWYTTFTPLELLDRREDADGYGAWLGHPDQGDKPFILVLVSFFKDQDKGQQPIMAPFAHIGLEMPSKEAVDAIAEKGKEWGCLAWPPTQMPDPVGYICALTDPDGNMIEFSYDQGVYEKAQEVWGMETA